ncbi:hypothetical protein [Kribbella kalugense]|uniref:Uncharacterized protein n=1 Tax=Kribbella kalugense TaxID=2512221 RepID=A0A4R7ZKH8_9ACTN|nr:hypothetical protein [Kribbella kalugense]TDW15620.1 hypothetical protein EV650_7108 [Kribbella kalugense]
MSETSSEGRGGRFSRWRSRSRGTNTMKAGFTLAKHNAGNLNKATLEGISRAKVTPADLQQTAQAAVNAEARGGAYIAQSQRLGQVLTDRMQANRAPQGRTINPIRRAVRGISRWHHQRNGAKIVKAGMVMAAKQAKNADPGVKYALDPRAGGKLNPANIAALVEGRLDQVFGPQAMNAQQQQAQQGPGQQVQGPGQQVPQQGAQQAPSLMDQLQMGEQRQIALMAEMQQLQVQMQQLVQERMAQLEQEVANLSAMQGRMAQMNQQFNQQVNQQVGQPQAQVQQDPDARFNVGQHAIIQTGEPAQTGEAAQPGEPAVTGEPAPTAETAQLSAEGDPQQVPAPANQQAAEGDGPQLGGGDDGQQLGGGDDAQQVEGGEPPVVAAQPEVEGDAQQLGDGADGAQPQVAPSGAQQAVQGGPASGQQVEGDGRAAEELPLGEVWSRIAERQDAPEAQKTGPENDAAKVSAATDPAIRAGLNEIKPRPSTAAQATKTAQSSREDTTGAQRAGSAASKNTQQTGPRT